MNLENLRKMAKNKEITKELLKNENFKEEIKDGLKKECGVEITEQQLSKIIEDFENSLASNQVLSTEELGLVSGGINSRALIRASFIGVGAMVGKRLLSDSSESHELLDVIHAGANAISGITFGAMIGTFLADKFCDYYGIDLPDTKPDAKPNAKPDTPKE